MLCDFLIEREKQLREEGINEGRMEIASFLKDDGVDINYISKVTGISISDIEKI